MVFRFKYWLITVLCRRFCAGNENVKPLQTICCIFCRRMNLSEESLKGKKSQLGWDIVYMACLPAHTKASFYKKVAPWVGRVGTSLSERIEFNDTFEMCSFSCVRGQVVVFLLGSRSHLSMNSHCTSDLKGLDRSVLIQVLFLLI